MVWEKIKNVPKLSKPLAVFCCVINVILPGSGTITASCMTDEPKVSKVQIVVGVLQFLTSIVLIGYFWSWYWGYLIVGKAFELGEFAGKTPQAKPGQAAVSNL